MPDQVVYIHNSSQVQSGFLPNDTAKMDFLLAPDPIYFTRFNNIWL
jgi:hypothetical protein